MYSCSAQNAVFSKTLILLVFVLLLLEASGVFIQCVQVSISFYKQDVMCFWSAEILLEDHLVDIYNVAISINASRDSL